MWEKLQISFNNVLYPTPEHKEVLKYLESFEREYTIRNLNHMWRIMIFSFFLEFSFLFIPTFYGYLRTSLVIFLLVNAVLLIFLYKVKRDQFKHSLKRLKILQAWILLNFLFIASAFNAFQYNGLINIHLYIVIFAYISVILLIPASDLLNIAWSTLFLNICGILLFHDYDFNIISYEIASLVLFISVTWYFGVVTNRHRILLWVKLKKHENENELLKELAVKDSMTQFFNHDHIFRLLENSIQHAQNSNKSLALLIIDIDNFKQINDNHGHLKGDEVLLKISQSIRVNVRERDILGRHGGEEFMIIFPDASKNQALSVSERIRETIQGLQFENLHVTMSGGLALYDNDTCEELIAKADQNLYLAKSLGKNRICS